MTSSSRTRPSLISYTDNSALGEHRTPRGFRKRPFSSRPGVWMRSAYRVEWRQLMPLINVKVIEGVFTEAQKAEIVQKLTEAMVRIEGENMRSLTLVILEEVKSGDWGVGGKPVTTADVKAMAAGTPPG
ncbi:4-oxalocrotonate tautomerase family protein [Microtetraspora sp. AC03309]|nr:4-oxalocrotonate tautomerase family protein [Microtetraspora sp. AC03309]